MLADWMDGLVDKSRMNRFLDDELLDQLQKHDVLPLKIQLLPALRKFISKIFK